VHSKDCDQICEKTGEKVQSERKSHHDVRLCNCVVPRTCVESRLLLFGIAETTIPKCTISFRAVERKSSSSRSSHCKKRECVPSHLRLPFNGLDGLLESEMIRNGYSKFLYAYLGSVPVT
jgi:hypothetical protein